MLECHIHMIPGMVFLLVAEYHMEQLWAQAYAWIVRPTCTARALVSQHAQKPSQTPTRRHLAHPCAPRVPQADLGVPCRPPHRPPYIKSFFSAPMRLYVFLALVLALSEPSRAQTCGCPAGYYGGYYAGAPLPTLTTSNSGSTVGYYKCLGFSRYCAGGGSPCASYKASWDSTNILTHGHNTCKIGSTTGDTSCALSEMNSDPQGGVAKTCYCYQCTPCPAGTFNPTHSGQTAASCLNCPANYWSMPGSTSCVYSYANTTMMLDDNTKFPAYTGLNYIDGYNLWDASCGSNPSGCKDNYIWLPAYRNIRALIDNNAGAGRGKRHTFLACDTCIFRRPQLTSTMAGVSLEVNFHQSGWGNNYRFCDPNGDSYCDDSAAEHGPGFSIQWNTANIGCHNSLAANSISTPGVATYAWPSNMHWRGMIMYVDFQNNKQYLFMRNVYPVRGSYFKYGECWGLGANIDWSTNNGRTPSRWSLLQRVESDGGSMEGQQTVAFPAGAFLDTSTGVAGPCPINTFCPTLVDSTACPSGTYQPGTAASACTTCPGGGQSTPNLARACGANKNAACTLTASTDCCAISIAVINDGVYKGGVHGNTYHTNTACDQWIRVDMESSKSVRGGTYFLRQDGSQSRSDGFKVWIGDSTTYNGAGNTNCYTQTTNDHHYYPHAVSFQCIGTGRYFFLHGPKCDHLSVTELEVFPALSYTGNAVDICGCPPGAYLSGGGCVYCSAGACI